MIEDFSTAADRLSFADDMASRKRAAGPPGRCAGTPRRNRRRPRAKPVAADELVDAKKNAVEDVPAIDRKKRLATVLKTSATLGRVIDHLVDFARYEAAKLGHVCIVEFAGGSESTYTHVRRGGHWYGFRVSSHWPAYACSRDYAQMLLGRVPYERELAEAKSFIAESIRDGGLIVSDPHEVRRLILLREVEGVTQQGEPLTIARAELSSGEVADIRHRANAREKWAAEQRGVPHERIYATKSFILS